MKRFFCVLFSLLFIFSLAGCAPSDPGTTSEPTSEAVSEPATTEKTTQNQPPVSSQSTETDTDTDVPVTTGTETVQKRKTAEEILSETQHYVGLCDQIHGRVIICDLAAPDWTDDKAVVWEYKHNTQGKENYGWIAGLKFRHSDYYGGDVMLFCAPRCKGYIVSMETKQVLLTAEDTGVNPHSVELLPNGTFIVGSSNDGVVSVYAPGATKPCYNITLAGNDNGTPDVHGVLWDPEYDTLWVAGGQKLRGFFVTGTAEKPTLTQYAEYTAPHGSIHDLAALYGEKSALLLTTTGGIIKFDKDKERFSYGYSCNETGQSYGYVPGCGLFADGVLTFTAITERTKVYQDWDTNVVFVCVPIDDIHKKVIRLTAPNDAYYKLRIFNTDYQ